MVKRHNHDKSSDEDMTKRRSSRNADAAAKRKLSNGKIDASLKGMYDEVVNEPVPDEMNNFDSSATKPKG